MKKSVLFLLCILFCCCSTARTDNYNDDQKSSCVTKKVCENCTIESVLYFEAKRDNFYLMQVRFNHCLSMEKRKELVRDEVIKRHPISQNQTICIDEYLGKKYNEYRYEINIKNMTKDVTK